MGHGSQYTDDSSGAVEASWLVAQPTTASAMMAVVPPKRTLMCDLLEETEFPSLTSGRRRSRRVLLSTR
jgi:hypothetical protein